MPPITSHILPTATMYPPLKDIPVTLITGESRTCLPNPMIWNWNTIGVCFVTEDWRINDEASFAMTCLAAFGLTLLLQFARRVSREWKRHLLARNAGDPQEFPAPIAGIELAIASPPAAAQSADAAQSAQPRGPQSVGSQSAGRQSVGSQSADAQPAQPLQPALVSGPGNGQDANAGLNADNAANRVPPSCSSFSFLEYIIEAALYTLRLVVIFVLLLMTVSFNGYIIICILTGYFCGTLLFRRDPVPKANNPNVCQRLFQRRIVFGYV